MTIIERIETANQMLATANISEINFKFIGAIRDLLHDTKLALQGKLQIQLPENSDLMSFSDYTLKDAKKRLNVFDYRIDNINGTEFEVANVTNASAYIVDFRPFTKQASCTCPDFVNRKRICKHIAFVHESVNERVA